MKKKASLCNNFTVVLAEQVGGGSGNLCTDLEEMFIFWSSLGCSQYTKLPDATQCSHRTTHHCPWWGSGSPCHHQFDGRLAGGVVISVHWVQGWNGALLTFESSVRTPKTDLGNKLKSNLLHFHHVARNITPDGCLWCSPCSAAPKWPRTNQQINNSVSCASCTDYGLLLLFFRNILFISSRKLFSENSPGRLWW